MPNPKSGKRLAYEHEEREQQIDAMLRRAQYHHERASALLERVRRANAKAAGFVEKAKAKAKRGTGGRARKK